MGKLEAIWIKRAKGGPMDPVERAELVEDSGIAGNANRGGRRQVTLIEQEVFERLGEALGVALDPSWRRANLMVSGFSLKERRGESIRVGQTIIRIEGETRPCEQMDEALPGLRRALSAPWLGGGYGVVTAGGEIVIGDDVTLAD